MGVSSVIVTCGEAIVDLVPDRDAAGAPIFRPVLGGSLFNVALGVGRLGGRAGFLWEVSTDQFGAPFLAALREAGVDLSLTRVTDRPSAVAVVDLSGPEPRYSIADPGRIMSTFEPGDVREVVDRSDCFHTGSAILALEPLGSRLEALCRAIADRMVVSIDFNVRPPSVSDREAYRARLARLERTAAILKASDVDLEFLHGDVGPDVHLDRWLASGAALGIVTLGDAGAVAATPAGRVHVPARPVAVRDTVGAGDAFMAGLLAALQRRGPLSRDGLTALDAHALSQILAYATDVAAACCRHQGCHMPWPADLAAAAC